MLQIGRFLCRGQGAILVMGPLGAALVPLSLADGAADVVWGRADTQTWLAQVQADGDSALLLDCAGEQPYLTVLGGIQLRMRSAGQIAEQVWTDPIWAWPFNPGEWQTFEATIVDGDEVTWMVPAADRVEAGEIRIGRSLDELEALASLPVDTMGFLIHSTETPTQRPVAVVPESPKEDAGAYDVAAAEAKFLATVNKDERSSAPAAESLAVVAEQVVATMPSDDSSAARASRERPRHAADPVEDGADPGQGQEAPDEQGTGAAKAAGSEQAAGSDSPSQADGALPAAAGADEEDSMAQTLVDQPPVPRPPAARPPVATAPPPAEDSHDEIAPDVLAGMNAEATQARRAPHNVGPSAPVAFLIHGGTVPVEVSRDVIIGRDPDARALTGRPMATVLRVPSPATEISRSHCAVMMTAPGAWSLMDLGSANGTILRHADGSFQDVTPMVTIALNDGDLIDVGEGTTIEFRVR